MYPFHTFMAEKLLDFYLYLWYIIRGVIWLCIKNFFLVCFFKFLQWFYLITFIKTVFTLLLYVSLRGVYIFSFFMNRKWMLSIMYFSSFSDDPTDVRPRPMPRGRAMVPRCAAQGGSSSAPGQWRGLSCEGNNAEWRAADCPLRVLGLSQTFHCADDSWSKAWCLVYECFRMYPGQVIISSFTLNSIDPTSAGLAALMI